MIVFTPRERVTVTLLTTMALLALGINLYRAYCERVAVRIISPQPPPAITQ